MWAGQPGSSHYAGGAGLENHSLTLTLEYLYPRKICSVCSLYLGAFRLSRDGRTVGLKKNQNAPRPSEHPLVREEKMSQRLGGIQGCKYKTSSWHLNGFPDGNNIGSTV